MDKFTVKKSEGYGGCRWDGSNAHKHLYGADLSKAIREAFKECKIKGVTVRAKTYTGGQSITISIKTTEQDFISFEEYKKECMKRMDFERFNYYYDENRNHYYWTKLYDMPREKSEHLYEMAIKNTYETYIKGRQLNEHFFDKYECFSESFKVKLNMIKKVVDSFNYDDSNAMIDYFDRGFYESYEIKPMKKVS